jgi:hypothetical protein
MLGVGGDNILWECEGAMRRSAGSFLGKQQSEAPANEKRAAQQASKQADRRGKTHAKSQLSLLLHEGKEQLLQRRRKGTRVRRISRRRKPMHQGTQASKQVSPRAGMRGASKMAASQVQSPHSHPGSSGLKLPRLSAVVENKFME